MKITRKQLRGLIREAMISESIGVTPGLMLKQWKEIMDVPIDIINDLFAIIYGLDIQMLIAADESEDYKNILEEIAKNKLLGKYLGTIEASIGPTIKSMILYRKAEDTMEAISSQKTQQRDYVSSQKTGGASRWR